MTRLIAIAVSALLLVGAGVVFWRSGSPETLPVAPTVQARAVSLPVLGDPVPEPPKASPKTREEKRFGRLDKDKNGAITTAEYFAARQKAFLRLDANGDGRLSFDEWAIKAREKFAKADGDSSKVLNAAEFATTAVVRKAKPTCACPPARSAAADGDDTI